jgi:hypothetical protein
MAAQLQTDAFMSEIENDVNSSFTPNFVLAGDDVTSLIMASSTNQISIGTQKISVMSANLLNLS